MKLVLVRHGETDWNKLGKFQGHCDIPLNSRGIVQARETARAVVAWKHSAVHSSPLQRTIQVAEEISLLSGMPVVEVAGFKELGLGDLEGVTGEQMLVDWPEVSSGWRDDPAGVSMPNGESLRDLQDRAWNSLVELEQAHPQEDALIIVSHNFAIRAMVGKVLGMPLYNFHRMSLSLSSISVLESDQRGRRLVGYNSTSHLSSENR
jgi:broad specificity phosphatase PhoE